MIYIVNTKWGEIFQFYSSYNIGLMNKNEEVNKDNKSIGSINKLVLLYFIYLPQWNKGANSPNGPLCVWFIC